jgi:hypothetical protein
VSSLFGDAIVKEKLEFGVLAALLPWGVALFS